jgi:hypothetical protein
VKKKAFAYLEGMVAADDAPVMDNPARLYCPSCRSAGQLHCTDPGYCGNLRPMKPLPTPPDAFEQVAATNPPSQPRRGSKQLQTRPVLDDTTGKVSIQSPMTDQVVPELPGRLLGRRTTLKPIPPSEDWKEQSWDWFMENITHDLEGRPL